ncbi:hypothetical protein KHM83_13265 [Fusibacter paucivorans]|uniref:DUF2975 domain-containing protein n=1 Tax=Fusibacter paucivorans TaxID=76009 RepID=A0ABS5PR59_9FIRM|nr:hypothetical protein [Fusibacter paucivorans]MBS7527649.1 hypothetical protein [Fusibacter paucivorans]
MKKIMQLSIVTLGLYYLYRGFVEGILHISAVFIKDSFDLNWFTTVPNILMFALGLVLVVKPTVVMKHIKCADELFNHQFDHLAVGQLILKMLSLLLITSNLQIIMAQASAIPSFLEMGSMGDMVSLAYGLICVRGIMVCLGIIVFWKAYEIAGIIYKVRQ